MTFTTCTEPGCNARVKASGPHDKCQRHRERRGKHAPVFGRKSSAKGASR